MTKPSTSDPQLVRAILDNILTAIDRIERRFTGIYSPDDFVSDDKGIDRLDGIAMMLIAIGEQLKQLDAISNIDLNARYPQVDWKGAKGIRDFLSHHYFVLDAEVIFDVCQNKIAGLKHAIAGLRNEYPSFF
ncbi:MAG: DUF86 domain-containing protein [Caldilineaceae bacterium]|nr:DUF86 domain-containing protein [Caldilineaceae bacterium]